jgi:2-amino-4-hydroxy-6-hydroxymethyldihydropteridine diphosphokinase
MPAGRSPRCESDYDAAATFDATLGLGSNMGDRTANIDDAIRRLTADGAIRLVSRSSLYRTAPWGVTDQDWFLNACIAIKTGLSPRELLRRCQQVESDMGRVRVRHWGPRNIDVDVLTFRGLKIDEPDFVVPHPRIAERAFVLVPLKDVAPGLTFDGASIDSLLAKLDDRDVSLYER